MAELDLLTWPDYRDTVERLAREVEAAHQAYEIAQRRYLYAPHGEIRSRSCALRTANARLLAAELEYHRALRAER